MGHYSPSHYLSGHNLSGHYGVRVQRVYTSDPHRVITLQQDRVIRAALNNRLIAADNVERLVNMPGIEVVEIDTNNRLISISLDDRIVVIDNVVRITEAD